MSGGNAALMRTRCPACGTVFRVTSEQLRARAGQVRCGQCQVVFNAFDQLLPGAPAEGPGGAVMAVERERNPKPVPAAEPQPELLVLPSSSLATSPPVGSSSAPAPEADVTVDAAPPVACAPESPEETTRQAREAGLVAARELADTAAYDRWSAGTFAGGALPLAAEVPRATWPFILASLALLLALLAQGGLHWRGDIVRQIPAAAALYQALGMAVPLPREAELVVIDASDLQSDRARGLYVLQATLRNRAAFDQAWPTLELSLTDVADRVMARRLIEAVEYLPPGAPTASFSAQSEIGLRLWIEAREVPAAGYRLYLFYP